MKIKIASLLLCLFLISESLAQKRVQHALVFDGVDDVVRCQSNSSTNLNKSAITVEAWINPLDFQFEPKLGTIVARHYEAANRGFSLAAGGSGQLYFGVFDDSSAEITTAANTVLKNTWTHVAATFDRYVLRVYVNGNLTDSLIDSTAVGDPGTIPLTLGNHHSLDRPFWGSLDEVRLWSKALTASEIKQAYKSAYCGFLSDLRAYYKFNKGRAATRNSIYFRIPDWSGLKNDGVLYNFKLDGTISNYNWGVYPEQIAISHNDTVFACDQYKAPSLTTTWYNSGVYVDTVYSYRGCDSALNIVLTIANSSRDTVSVRSCGNYTLPSGLNSVNVSGVYTDILKNAEGCDSILTLLVKIGPDSTFADVTNCQEFKLPYSNRMVTESGVFVDTLSNYLGCDSLMFFNIEILPQSEREIELEICDSVMLPASGSWIFQSGLYADTLVNFMGCDSVVNYKVKSLVSRAFYQDYACGMYESPSGKYIWDQSGVWYDTLVNYRGCDSIIQIDLQVSPITDTTLRIDACRSYRAPSRRFYITESGTYYDTIMNAFGCDSIIKIIANITKFNKALISASDTLRATEGYFGYQWLRCDKGFLEIAGEMDSELIVTEPGNYSVRMEMNGCLDTSECVNVAQNGVSVFQNVTFNVYPNPSGGRVFVSGENLDASYVEIRDLQGRILEVISFMNGYFGPEYVDINQKGWFYMILIKDKYREALPVLIE